MTLKDKTKCIVWWGDYPEHDHNLWVPWCDVVAAIKELKQKVISKKPSRDNVQTLMGHSDGIKDALDAIDEVFGDLK